VVRATRINHVSISASDLEESTRFYEELFGMERIPTPIFETPVQWLRVGDLQLHLFLDETGKAPERHHLGMTIDDFDEAYAAVSARMSDEWGAALVELPSGQGQLYFHDPAGNLIELNWSDADRVDRSQYPSIVKVADRIPQTEDSRRAVLYLEPSS
jgi:catechol 2,3-dioxygenase-like lactoylglutathione lyase family enzyme